MPFCSNRCRMIDLGRWLEERYSLPYQPTDAAEQTGAEGDDSPYNVPDAQSPQ